MSSILEFFEPGEGLGWLLGILLFYITSLAIVWLIAFVLARVSFIVKKDAELRVWLGSLVALCFYSLMVLILTISLALHYRTLEISLIYTVPWILYFLVVYKLALDLNSKIHMKISEQKSMKEKTK
jgi:Ca2+/Na+ antiporter